MKRDVEVSRESTFVLQYKRADKEAWTPDHQGFGPQKESLQE